MVVMIFSCQVDMGWNNSTPMHLLIRHDYLIVFCFLVANMVHIMSFFMLKSMSFSNMVDMMVAVMVAVAIKLTLK
jgi:hypothetical protein